jgi:WD40 repeat protein
VLTGQQIGPAMRHDGPIYGAILTIDDSRILSWSTDQTLRLWDMETSQQIGPAMQHDAPVVGAILNKNGSRVVSWSADSALRFWNIGWPHGNLLKVACSFLLKHDFAEVSRRYEVTIDDPICNNPARVDWHTIQRSLRP